jgi:hypothetical protein
MSIESKATTLAITAITATVSVGFALACVSLIHAGERAMVWPFAIGSVAAAFWTKQISMRTAHAQIMDSTLYVTLFAKEFVVRPNDVASAAIKKWIRGAPCCISFRPESNLGAPIYVFAPLWKRESFWRQVENALGTTIQGR